MEKSPHYGIEASQPMMSSNATAPPTYEQATGPSASYGFHVPPEHSYPNQGPPPPVQTQPQPHPQPTYYMPQGGAPQPSVVIVQQPTVLLFGPRPVIVTCPQCGVQKLTHIKYMPSGRTHLFAAILCLLGFWCCACLPYCVESCMNANHYCGNCDRFLGTYVSPP